MSSYPLELPEELMQEVRRLAEVNQVPLEQWLITAIKRHVAAERSLSQHHHKVIDILLSSLHNFPFFSVRA
jgi:hypothetical protein